MGTGDGASRFGLGCVNLGSMGGQRGVRLVHEALDLGVRFFDTADAYGAGSSEQVMGRALQGRRHRAFVATKGGYVFTERTALEQAARRVARGAVRRAGPKRGSGLGPASLLASSRRYESQDFSARHLRLALEASLRRLRTDYVDLYQLHGPREVCDDDVLAMMLDLRSEGKILGFGVGLESLDPAMDWLGTGALSSIQIPFGVLDPEAGDEVIPRAATLGVSVVARGVFASGFLVNESSDHDALLRPGQAELRAAVRSLASAAGVPALQIAAWFVTCRPGVTTVLVGTSSAGHLEQSVRYVDDRPPDDIAALVDGLVGRDGVPRVIEPSPGDQGGS
jgi:aryl-alcohol dehydrogenase-like predicted oxidoreductase